MCRELRSSKGDSSNFSSHRLMVALSYRRQLAAAATARLTALAAGATGFFSRPFVRSSLGVGGASALAGNLALLFC